MDTIDLSPSSERKETLLLKGLYGNGALPHLRRGRLRHGYFLALNLVAKPDIYIRSLVHKPLRKTYQGFQ